jgi:hypothetical protein
MTNNSQTILNVTIYTHGWQIESPIYFTIPTLIHFQTENLIGHSTLAGNISMTVIANRTLSGNSTLAGNISMTVQNAGSHPTVFGHSTLAGNISMTVENAFVAGDKRGEATLAGNINMTVSAYVRVP